jgi:hypothetical protein
MYVQAAREAARRSQCTNNLKQSGLGLHNHHDVLQRFPPGAAADQTPFGTGGGGFGSSWMVYLLPYIEQRVVYDKWQFYDNSGVFNPNNMDVLNGLVIPAYTCPSSPLQSQWASCTHSSIPNKFYNRMCAHYVGISGAINGLIPGYNETRVVQANRSGLVGLGGTLIPSGKLRFADLRDGTSNTLVISEQGDWLFTTDGTQRDFRAGASWGWSIGTDSNVNPPSFNAGAGVWNLATVRYRMNQKTGWTEDCGGLGVCGDCPNNTPLNSAHPGGVNGLLGDGSVRFISDTVTLDLLARLVTRDDGKTLESF